MTIHRFKGQLAVCGASARPAGPVHEVYFRDLCQGCRDWTYHRGKKLIQIEKQGHPPQKKRKRK